MKARIISVADMYSNLDSSLTIGMVISYNGKKHAIAANVTTIEGQVELVLGWRLLSSGKVSKTMDLAVRDAIRDYSIA